MAKNEIKYLTAIKTDKPRKKYCRFKKYGIRYIDYKDVEFLKKFINDQRALAEPYNKASNAAIEEYNNTVKGYNELIEKLKEAAK